ncbi:uncharacterized protein LOC108106089 [Drosophila eugracilis]|uniref:uncharacterized protein LOC108106089 n=1 Tax=Drosophila eugracilis TaxID=29029 RepID=UPI0007E6DBD9|nr:uncharacterized protein LOC108106089 [Drosophila eugracilis]
MKAALLILCLAVFMALYAADYVCERDGNNQPDCSNSSNVEVPIRNFWDPTRYWWCNSTSSTAYGIQCQPNGNTTTGFDSALKKCVPWDEWTWTQPCA